jgi:UDP-glucose:(heptosyl)LPS alpha-1,3-glucosyltransferase
MKLLLAILSADPSRGGAERYTIDVANRLASRGHNITVAATEFGPEGSAGSTSPGVFQKLLIATTRTTRLGRYLSFIDQLETCRSNHDVLHAMLPVRSCDIYHPHAGIAAEAVASGHAKYTSGVLRLIAMAANRVNVKRQTFANVERQLLADKPQALRKPPLVACLSDYITSALVRHYRHAGPLAHKLFNGTDLEKFSPEKAREPRGVVRARYGVQDESTAMFLMLSHDFHRKGLGPLISALGMLKSRGIGSKEGGAEGAGAMKLVVAGRDDPLPYIRQAQKLGVADLVVFAGAVSDVVSLYNAADCFVLPTRHDPCSLVVLEALAMGLPVISTAANGACEVMTQGQHGLILPDAESVGALAAALDAMMSASKRAQMKQAIAVLRPQLSLDAHIQTLEQLYELAMSRKMSQS